MRRSDSKDPATSRASFRVRAYLRSHRWLSSLLNVLRGAHGGFWLGLLDPAALRELTDRYYGPTHKRYHRSEYNLSGLQPWESAALDEYFGRCRSILVGAAGGGREVLALARRYPRVDAFECNPRLVERCRALLESEGVSARIVRSAEDEVPDGLDTYDGAILGWGAYIHILGRQRRVRLLEQFHRHLEPDGPFLLSFHVRANSVSERLAYRIARLIRFLRRAPPVEAGDWIATSYDRRFSREEIRGELAEGGFELVFYSEELYPHAVARALPRGGAPP